MGEQIENNNPIGTSLAGVFKIGDLVSWKKLHQTSDVKQYGYIIKIYTDETLSNDRGFLFAKIRKTSGDCENFMLHELQKES